MEKMNNISKIEEIDKREALRLILSRHSEICIKYKENNTYKGYLCKECYIKLFSIQDEEKEK